MLNLRTCKIGQKLRLRDGMFATYLGPRDDSVYSHRVKDSAGNVTTHMDDGRFSQNAVGAYDVVEILSFAPTPHELYVRSFLGQIFQLQELDGKYEFILMGENWDESVKGKTLAEAVNFVVKHKYVFVQKGESFIPV